jgi:hypothetical protein
VAIQKDELFTSIEQRDWVAVMALQGILANADYIKGSDLRRDPSVAAKKAYELADAMIELSATGQRPKAKT